jgi:DNA-directed RNA polymerase specialized sigma24 family protein
MTLPPFQRLLDAHGPALARYLAVAAGGEAEDCYQETVLAALAAYPALRSHDNLRGWLFTIARRKALDAHRRRSRRALPVAVLPEGNGAAPPEPPDTALWAGGEMVRVGQRDALLLRYVADLAHADVAQTLGCSPAAARRRVADGLARLREVLTDA